MKCEIIRDLLPSYVDGLTSEVSNEAVEEHLAQCEDCRAYCEKMRQEEPKTLEKLGEEIDYFIRVREQTVRKVLIAVTVTAVVFSLALGAWQNRYGGKSAWSDEVRAELQVIEGITTLVFEPVEEGYYLAVGYTVDEPVDGKIPLRTLNITKYRINPFREYDRTANRYPISFKEDGHTVLDLFSMPHELIYGENDFIAIPFNDCIKTVTLADLRDGDISSLQ
jgi:hypothetical protein